ncbi:MAG: aldo/keto reductase [Halobacteria archaeon]|nr:aldo/keto reductase [Halobacteria archaeon]
MKKRSLGEIEVSEVGFGGWGIGGDEYGNSYGPTDDDESVAAVRKARELGVDFFDTADVYGHGHSEEILAEAVETNSDDIRVCTKGGADFYQDGDMNFDSQYIKYAAVKSIERLRTDYIDVYMLQNPPRKALSDSDTYAPLRRMKDEGVIGQYGVSVHEPAEGRIAAETGDVDVVEVGFNIIKKGAKRYLFDYAEDNDVSIVAREPLANGFLTGKYDEDHDFPTTDMRKGMPDELVRQRVRAGNELKRLVEEEDKDYSPTQAAIKYVLAHDAVSVTIPGAKTPEQVEENVAAATEYEPMSDEMVEKIESLVF